MWVLFFGGTTAPLCECLFTLQKAEIPVKWFSKARQDRKSAARPISDGLIRLDE
jgi:hypothetical protein